ncbi:succinylglutamate desuccinylase/aspartoacylase family protein [Falsiroseomonas sp. HW251]|uniref:succinylglutamate desuccinylase/aspartoacylase family protein n=1 Tax=Falsiroseomonas sp. HW251 TaxID=3390998 RepID=UPI003D322F85
MRDAAIAALGLERRAGARTDGQLTLGYGPDGMPIGSPVIVLGGAQDGPTLWIQCCVHGAEVGGIVGLHRFIEALDLGSMRGTIIGVLTANPLAFLAQQRNTPFDGENLNRVFPGAEDGPHTRQVAHRLIKAACSVSDAILDLHSGGDRSHVPHYSLCWADGSDAAKRAFALAGAADVATVWAATDIWLQNSMMAQATRRGVPMVIVECGGAAQVSDEHADLFARSIRSIAAAIGILPGRPVRRARAVVDRCTLVNNTRGGLFEAFIGPGAIVAKDQPIGRVVALDGREVEVIRSPVGPAYVAAIRKTWSAVTSGEMVAECNEFTP